MWILEWGLFRIVNHLQKLLPAENEKKIFSHSSVNISKYRWQGSSGHGKMEWHSVVTQRWQRWPLMQIPGHVWSWGESFVKTHCHSVDFTWHGSHCHSGNGNGNTISSLYFFFLCIYLWPWFLSFFHYFEYKYFVFTNYFTVYNSYL